MTTKTTQITTCDNCGFTQNGPPDSTWLHRAVDDPHRLWAWYDLCPPCWRKAQEAIKP